MLPKCDPVHKISIISRGMALGYTMSLPENDRVLVSKTKFEQDLSAMLGGRVAEEMVFGDVTNGAVDDLDKVTKLARAMVTQYGMSDKMGPMVFGQRHEMIFLGRDHRRAAQLQRTGRPRDRQRGQPHRHRGVRQVQGDPDEVQRSPSRHHQAAHRDRDAGC